MAANQSNKPGAPVTGGKSKRRYRMRVNDAGNGRIFTDDETGEELDDTGFKEKEGDFTTDGNHMGGRESDYKDGSKRHETKPGSAYQAGDNKPSLGSLGRKPTPAPSPAPSPDPEKKKKQTSALSGKGYYRG